MENNINRAYTEVLKILEQIPKKDYDKIPSPVINEMLQNFDEKYEFEYNLAVPYAEQDISEEARQILKEFQTRFWK